MKPLSSHMFLGAVALTGEVSPPIRFTENCRLTADRYIKVLDRVLIPWIVKVAPANGVDPENTPTHSAYVAQNFLRERKISFGPKTCGLLTALV